MFLGENLSHFSPRNVVIWFTLAFQAGCINVGGFLACRRFVTHVTGFATLFGADVARLEYREAFSMLSVPLFFILGAMISSFLVDRRMIRGLAPRYATVLFIMALTNILLVAAGNLGQFGSFNDPMVLHRDYLFLAVLCFVAGLQNAMVTSASGAVVRTTHLTGITTDLGIGLVRVLFHTHKLNRRDEIRACWVRFGLIASFATGSAVAAFLFLNWQYWGFLFPAVISTLLWLNTLNRDRRHPWRRRLMAEARA